MAWIRNRLSGERGSVMVEVLVGTILLAMTTAAVLDGLDGAQATARKNKDRSLAATLAQQDIERMRSMAPPVLDGLSQTRTVTVAYVPYTVVSRAEWVSDDSGLVSCISSNTQAEYMRLTSTVTSPASEDSPVSAASLLTPSGAFGDDTGTAAVKLTDRDGQPLEGIAVNLSGPGSEAATTNDLGCAIFAYIDTGNWTASVDSGLVNWNGGSPSTSAVTVAVGKTSLVQMELDQPASLRASFVTPAGVGTTYKALSVANSKLTNGVKSSTWTTPTATRDVDKLFPFHDGYGVYAGSCKANNPALWDADYFETSGFGFAALDPGELLEPVQVVVPQLAITVWRLNSSSVPQAFTQAQFYVKERDSAQGCTATVASQETSTLSPSPTTYTFNVAVPFGNWEVCAATRTSSSNSWRRKVTSSSSSPPHRNLTTTALAIANQNVALDTSTSTSNDDCL
jgi:type II secretory pathway pseudopilin PulG